MNEFIWTFIQPFIPLTIAFFVLAGLLWLFFHHGIDKLRHPHEWRDKGSSGEQMIYLMLTKKFHIPEKQILRNLHIPKASGGTTEIDLLVVSTRGLLVFECKNYAGNIYGDVKRKQWVQYLGGKKSYFYNPFMQNRGHVKHLRAYLAGQGIPVDNLPIIPIVATTTDGKWKVRNLVPGDYLLGYNCKLKKILAELPESEVSVGNLKGILVILNKFSRN